ncbi:MAG: hypothetical protein LBG12_03480 [Synergistaceae bacterium]|jgi:hypothetical protein|nr:hypothetical protein [Synergistaceae bacterium]
MAKNNTNVEEPASQPQTAPKTEVVNTTPSAPPQETARFVTVRNLDVGTRDYPLADGSSLYLPMKHKGADWPKIAESQISPALRTAERKGHIQILREEA